MEDDVQRYLATHPSHHEAFETWPVQGRLRVRLSLSETPPPAVVSSSILAIVFNHEGRVLYLYPMEKTGSIAQLLIGGRPQAGESPQETVVREVSEETGWRVRPGRMIGFRHFHHLEPFSPQSDRPYPDFIQPIHVARAESLVEKLVVPGDHLPAEFMAYERVEKLIDPGHWPLLRASRRALDLIR